MLRIVKTTQLAKIVNAVFLAMKATQPVAFHVDTEAERDKLVDVTVAEPPPLSAITDNAIAR